MVPGDDLQGRPPPLQAAGGRAHQPAGAEEELPLVDRLGIVGTDGQRAGLALHLQELEEGGEGDVLDPPLDALGEHLGDLALQVRQVERLGQALEGAGGGQAGGGLGVAEGGHQDHRQGGVVAAEEGEELEAVHVRHPQVGEHEVDGPGLQDGHRLDAVGGGGDAHAPPPVAQALGEGEQDRGLVIHHQDRFHAEHLTSHPRSALVYGSDPKTRITHSTRRPAAGAGT